VHLYLFKKGADRRLCFTTIIRFKFADDISFYYRVAAGKQGRFIDFPYAAFLLWESREERTRVCFPINIVGVDSIWFVTISMELFYYGGIFIYIKAGLKLSCLGREIYW